MGSGREGGSPLPAMASAAKQGVNSSTLTHKLQREELLDGGSHSYINADPDPNPRTRTPRAGNTPLQSPRSMSPLRSLSTTEMVSAEIASATLVDFQEAILRASNAQKSMPRIQRQFQEEVIDFQMQKTTPRASKPVEDEQNEAPPALAMAATRSKSDLTHMLGQQKPRHKSPFPPGRMKSLDGLDQEAPAQVRSTRKADATHGPPSEWVLLDRGKSPRRSKVSSTGAAPSDETHELSNERKSSRNSSRRSKVEALEDLPDADLGMGDANRATRRGHVRPHTRQHKRKASESNTVITGASSPPESYVAHRSPPESYTAHGSPPLHQRQQQVPEQHAPPYRAERHSTATSSPSTASRRASREARAIGSSDWLEFISDIIMWRHIPRSALLFGAGCFCIMSASLIQDSQYSTISILAYMALFYLAARFIKCNFLRGSIPILPESMLTEGDVLRLLRVLLPPCNVMLQNLGHLFSGEPMVTLKVAGALWFLARAGSMMNVWTLIRIAYFALFTVPRCYSSYDEHMKAQARSVLHWMRTTWSACAHKKAVLLAGFAVAWNFSSVSTRVCGAFLALVGVRAYQHVIRSELEIGSTFFNQDRPVRMSH
eukprot:c20829_g1_i1 orf=216-2021(+)